jgi:hypothetical protein
MNVVVDILPTVAGAWSLSAHDLPDLHAPSAAITGESADLHDDPERAAVAGLRLVFAGGLPSPYADRLFANDTESIWCYLYRPRDAAEMLAFADRIEPRYADYYANVDAYYSGLFEVTGLGDAYLGEFIAFRRPLGAAREFILSHEPSPDIVMVEDESRALELADGPRHVIWLSRSRHD